MILKNICEGFEELQNLIKIILQPEGQIKRRPKLGIVFVLQVNKTNSFDCWFDREVCDVCDDQISHRILQSPVRLQLYKQGRTS